MSENPQLVKSPISEALIEIRFNPDESLDYSVLLGLLYDKLKHTYNIIEDTGSPDFGKDAPKEVNFIPKNRIFSKDKTKLFSLGRGVLSINTLQYSRFSEFSKQINEVLEVHKSISQVSNIQRIALRYINKIETTKKREEVFIINHTLPSSLQEMESGFNLKSLLKFSDNSMELRFVRNPEAKEYFLDLEFFNGQERPYELEEIKEWITQSHKNIYTTFKDCLTEEFYNELLKG